MFDTRRTQGEHMKVTRITRTVLAITASVGLVVGVVSPAASATRTTVVIVASNSLTSLNPLTPDTNLVTNFDIAYLTGMGFFYYDNNKVLKKNPYLGSYSIVSNSPFKVKYTIKPGRVWSDGAPITGVDLLLSHILTSSAYSKKAGLGDPSDTKVVPAFNSGGYGGVYDSKVVGLPALSADKMSVTVTYDSFQPDWEIIGPLPTPVHALVEMADGKKALGTASENAAATAKFLDYFTSYNTAGLTAIGKVWSNDYNIKTINSSTNPLLLVSNGAFLVDSAVADQSATMTLNPAYNSGPPTSGITTVVYKFISDGTAASQALANKEIDIYQGQPSADAVAALKAMSGVTVIGGVSACFEHVDLRVGAASGSKGTYTGPFANSKNAAKNIKAKNLRTAFLLAYPRQQIVDTLIKPINPDAVVVGSSFLLPGQPGYTTIVSKTGVAKFNAGTQASRTAAALALVQKYYKKASATNQPVKVKLLWGQPNNSRRASEAALVKAELAKAGFDVTATGTSGWSGKLDDNSFDAEFFAWCPNTTSQTGTNANFQSDGTNNFLGYNNPRMDKVLHSLEAKLTESQIIGHYAEADKILVQDALTLPIFQHPAVTGYNSALKNVKPAPLTPNLVWNFWEWHF